MRRALLHPVSSQPQRGQIMGTALPWMHCHGCTAMDACIPRNAFPGCIPMDALPWLTHPAGAAWAHLSLSGWPNRHLLHPDLSVNGHSLALHCSSMTFSHYFILLLAFPFSLSHEFLWLFQREGSARAAQVVCNKVNHSTGLLLHTYPHPIPPEMCQSHADQTPIPGTTRSREQ